MTDTSEKVTELFNLINSQLKEEIDMAEQFETNKTEAPAPEVAETEVAPEDIDYSEDWDWDSNQSDKKEEFDWDLDFEFPEETVSIDEVFKSAESPNAEWGLKNGEPVYGSKEDGVAYKQDFSNEDSLKNLAMQDVKDATAILHTTKEYYSSELWESLYNLRKNLYSVDLLVKMMCSEDVTCYDALTTFVTELSNETSRTMQGLQEWLVNSSKTNNALMSL